MAEYVVPPAVEFVADQAKEYVSPYFGYFFSYEKIVEDFTNQREALESKKQRVEICVDGAKRQNGVIHKDVDNWLTRAEKELKETQNLKDEIDRVKCFKWCPKWGWPYSLSKKLAKKTPIISKLLETSNFAQVGYRRPLQGIEFITSTDFMDSESSKSALNQIMEAINSVNIIGLHGMPGVGKTTLAQEVGKHARKQKLFDKVVMFTMSQNPNIKNIQDKVADILGLKFEASSQDGKAEELLGSMQRVNKILVIVDDLWEEIKLESIGIPFGDDHKGCKILLTTRHQQVCTKMNCQKEIQLGILSEDEAWALFRDKAGLDDDSSTLNDVAKEVADQCKGLPLAIVVVAKALKGESLNGWTTVSQRFKESRHLDNEKVLGGVLKPLKLSYDYLKEGNSQMTGNDIQMCFLLCSLFPEDAEIPIEILIMCGIGVGLFPNASSIENKRNEIGIAIKKLQNSGLLLESDDAETIRVHDVVRDFAHWLTSIGENRFMVKDKLKEWPDMVESFECYTAIALWNCSRYIKIFQAKVEFSKLKTLFLQGERKRGDLLVGSSTFFEEMKALQVLYLENICFSLKGFLSLPNLKTLWCKNCKLKNFSSSLTNMTSLEILALEYTEFDEISEELVKLSTLKYLYLSPHKEMKIPPKLVSRLTSLQELHVTNRVKINLLELKPLPRLTALSFCIDQIPQENFVLPKLQRYAICVNKYCSCLSGVRTLEIKDFSSSLSAFNKLFCNVEKLKLMNVGGQKNIVPSIGEMGVNELTSLQLESCNDMEFLIDTTRDQMSTVAFSNLIKLEIRTMVSLKGLCNGFSPIRFLQNIKQVCIIDCSELQVIFQIDKISTKLIQTPLLSNLTILKLYSLPKLKRIWEVEPSHCAIVSLQSLKVVTIECCHNLKTIFSPYFAQSMLCMEELYIESCDGLEQVIDFAQEEEITKNCCWPKLKILRISFCESLKYVSPNTYAEGLQSLERVDIVYCPQLIQAFNIGKFKDGLQSIWNSETSRPAIASSEIQKVVIIRNCYKLKTIFSTCLALNMLHLQQLQIHNCDELEQVIGFTQEAQITENDYPLSCWLKLKILVITSCGSLKYLYPKGLQFLEHLHISDCSELVQVFNMEKVEPSHCAIASLQSLKKVEIFNCNKLKTIFSAHQLAQSMMNIEELYIRHCDGLEQIIGFAQEKKITENDYPFYCWLKLRILHIQYCESLKYVCTNTLIVGHQSLKYVLNDCPQLIQIFNMEQNKCGQNIVLPRLGSQESLENLTSLELKSSRKSIFLGPKYYVDIYNLNSITITNCDKLKYLFSEFTARTLVHLEFLNIWYCPSLEHLIEEAENVDEIYVSDMKNHYPLLLPKLKCVFIIRCKNLKYLCSSTLAQGLSYLEDIWIEACPRLIQVFNMEKNKDRFGLQESPSNLTSLTLKSLPELKCIWNGSNHCLPVHSLNIIEIENCDKLTYLFPKFIARALVHLESLIIWGCSSLEHLIEEAENVDEIYRKNHYPVFLPKLKVVYIRNCENLKYLCSTTLAQGLPYLESIDIVYCPRLIQMFNMGKNKDGFGVQESVTNLTSSELGSLSKSRCIWNRPNHYDNFHSLTAIKIMDCNKLTCLFSELTARTSELLEIRNRSSLEHLIEEAENMDEINVPNLFLPRLKTVTIKDCENLKYLCSSTLAKGHPHLESIDIQHCPQLIQVFNMGKNKKGFGLQGLVLSDVENCCQLCNIDFPVLNEDCIVVGNHEEVFQVQGGYSFSSLKTLKLRNLFELRIIWNDFAQVVTLENLTTLNLKDLKKLKYIFSPTTARSLSHLKDLFIDGCEEIERFILAKDQVSSSSSNGDTGPQAISFPNLTNIKVTNCGNLKSLFPFGSVLVLPKLGCLNVKRNSKLEQVFELEDEVEVAAKEEMIFYNLERLSLKELPSLIHFCPKGYHFVLPALRGLKVIDCSKLTTGFFIDLQELVYCKTKTPQLVEQEAIEEFDFNENIHWNRLWISGSQLPHIT